MNARDAQGQTPLHLACERGDVGCVRELLEECQARTDIKDKNGETPMHCAAKQDSAIIIEVRGQLRACIHLYTSAECQIGASVIVYFCCL